MIQKHVRGWMVYKRFKHLFGDKKKRRMRKLLDVLKLGVLAALVLLLLALASRTSEEPLCRPKEDVCVEPAEPLASRLQLYVGRRATLSACFSACACASPPSSLGPLVPPSSHRTHLARLSTPRSITERAAAAAAVFAAGFHRAQERLTEAVVPPKPNFCGADPAPPPNVAVGHAADTCSADLETRAELNAARAELQARESPHHFPPKSLSPPSAHICWRVAGSESPAA